MTDHTHARVHPGAWPVMLTPMHEDGAVDRDGVRDYADWLVRTGSAGIFTVALSSEMYDLSAEERLQLARDVVDAVDGRVPVVASAVGKGPDEVADAATAMAETGVSAVVLITSLLAREDAGEAEWRAAVERVLDRCPDVPLGAYEAPVPYKRLPSPESIAWLGETGRIGFYKDTCQDVEVMAARVEVTRGTPLRLFNAEIASLVASLRAGGAGFSGYAANVYPDLVAWLCRSWSTAPEAEVLQVQRLLTIAEAVLSARYPSSAKLFLGLSSSLGFGSTSRVNPAVFTNHQVGPLRDLAAYVESLGLAGLSAER